ncbi:hypothetical protein GGU10DRAFT_385385 [Lentinula aff. detonsa]|uniref:Uncharacterized protein n=1 Tax=Lentinula aff. detonsa TaxID=2804958 RepID=A0AA38KHP0_9AGAR|nr:hypothetical protein GGU10DRAFT_385385 [Lentinula aff. detonsa]
MLSPPERNQLHKLSAEMTFHSLLIKDETAVRKILAPALAAGSISDKDYAFTAARLGSLTNLYYFNYHHAGPAITAVVICETSSLAWRKRPSAFVRGFFLFPIAFAATALATQSAIARRIDHVWEGLDNPLGVGKAIHSRIRNKKQGVGSEESPYSEDSTPEFAPDTVESSSEDESSKPISSTTTPSSPSPPSRSDASNSNPTSRWDEIRASSQGKGTASTWDEIRQQHERTPGNRDNGSREH